VSKILLNGVGYDPIVVTDYWSGTAIDRGIWTPPLHKDAHINAIAISASGIGVVRIDSSAGDPIVGRTYLTSGTSTVMVTNGVGDLYVAPSGISIKANSDTPYACSITIYGYLK
jgi:hypothetical protein